MKAKVRTWIPWIPVLGILTLSCGPDTRDTENYGDLTTQPGGIVLNAENHPGGYGRGECLVCHNAALNLHRNVGTILDAAAMLDQSRKNGESRYCLGCHGSNGLTNNRRPALQDSVLLKTRPLPRRHDKCQLCHLKRVTPYVPAKHQPRRQHADHSLRHAQIEMSCNNCHDAEKFNYLRSDPDSPATFADSSPVCQQCHAVPFADWERGVHGKRTGSWQGEKVQNHCIDCHDPHSVKFKSQKAEPAPRRP